MLPAPSIYPRFAANQLLTESSLNQMVDYFDGQVRDTRIYLNGLGIYYGLGLSVTDNNDGTITLVVEKGVGVSSEGFLFKLEDDCSFKGFNGGVKILKEKLWKAGCPAEGLDEEYTVQELTEENLDDGTNLALTKDILKDKVVMFLCEFEESNVTGRDRCFNELDEKGISKSTTLRMLLFEKSKVERFAKSITGANTGQNETLPKLYLPRFGYTTDSVPSIRLSLIDTLSAFENNYNSIVGLVSDNNSFVDKIAKAYENASELFYKLFKEDEFVFKDFRSQLKQLRDTIFPPNETGEYLSIQYFYDYLKDLVLAYEEFACLDAVQQTSLFPNTCDFPKYLLLGIPNPSLDADGTPTVTPNDFRTLLQRPPIKDIGKASVDEIRVLFDRMKKLANHKLNVFLPYKIHTETTRITPSEGINRPLSEQAIPFYLDSEVLRPCWSPRLFSLAKTIEIPSYHPASQNPPYDFPLLYDMNKYEFFRVEGHFGKSLKVAMAEITQAQKRFNVPFAIQCVKLAINPNDITANSKIKGDFGDLERLYTKVRMDIFCLIDHEYRDSQIDFSAMTNQLPEELSSFKYLEFAAAHQSVFANNPDTLKDDCNLPVLEKLAAEYIRKKEEITSLVWFQNFAEKHPGLEHLGGVYKGGTLILVYIESQGDTVIADFCLPYNCCSNGPTVVYQISQVRPRIIMDDEFCGTDSTEYDIIATPPGSVVTGPGVKEVDGNFIFDPSVAAQGITYVDNKAEVTIKSNFEDLLVTKEITLFEPPVVQIKIEQEYSFGDDCRLDGVTYIFSDENNDADPETYKWMYNNGDDSVELSTERSFTHKFPLGENGEISVTARRGVCRDSDSAQIQTCPDTLSITFDNEETTVFLQGRNPVKLNLSIPGGTFEMTAPTGNTTSPNINITPDGNDNCLEKEYSLDLADLTVGLYLLVYSIKECGVESTIEFEIVDSLDPPDPPEPPAGGGGGFDEDNPQMPRSRSSRRPASQPTSKSSTKASTKPKSKTKDTSSTKTTSKTASKTAAEKAKPTSKKKTTTSSASKKKASPPKKETTSPKGGKLQNGARTMNLRRTAQQAVLKKLEDENNLKGKSFGLGMSAFLIPGNDLEQLNQRFGEAMKAVLASVKRSKAELKKDWTQFVEVLLQNYLDKRVALTPTSLDEGTIDLLKTQIGKMKELKMDVKTMQKNWNGKELEDALKASIIKKINSLF